MERTLAEFIKALRMAEVRVSTAETLDALSAANLVGYRDREFLKNSLSIVLPKTPDEKATFDNTFEDFFKFEDFAPDPANNDARSQDEGEDQEDHADGEGEGDGQGGGASEGRSSSKKKSKRTPVFDADPIDDEALGEGPLADAHSQLGRLLMRNDRVELQMSMAEAGKASNLSEIAVFTQKGLFTRKVMEAMGLKDLNQEISGLGQSRQLPERRLAQELKGRREALRERVRDYVEKQFLLHADADGRKLREELLRKVKLSNIEQRNFRLVQEVVYKLAKKLISLHSKRKKVFKRGQLNVSRTIRQNLQYDGALFDIHWKSVKVDRPKVFAICDVSGSVANYVRFMLMFLYSLDDVIPKIRSFCFSSDLGEVTDLFMRNNIEDAISKVMRDYAGGSTDYGQALSDFQKNCLDDVDNRTTIIVLGDARNNYGEPHQEILKEMYDRCKRLIWLNPEPTSTWNIGDSEMRRYGAYCHQVEECNSLMHMERIVGNLLRTIQ